MKRISYEGSHIFGANRESRTGTFETAPMDIGRCRAWALQFSLSDGGSGQVTLYVSAGDTDTWAQIGDTYALEDGTLIRDSVAPYRFIKAEVTADPGTDVRAILTLAI
ncbi:MAG: hypothetical protein VW443_10300 [Pseudomonadales bacterium]